MNFAKKIKQVRIANGFTQEQFAEKLSVSRQAISKYESGNGYPDVEKLIMISKTFHISLDYLLDDNLCDTEKYNNGLLDEDISLIIDIVEKYTGINRADIIGKSREKSVVEARQIAMFFAKRFTKISMKRIGNDFGGREHVTVVHSIDKINNLIKENDEYKQKLETMFWEIRRKIDCRAKTSSHLDFMET